MGRHRATRGVSQKQLPATPLRENAPVPSKLSEPIAPPSVDTPRANLDARQQRWLVERKRFERSQPDPTNDSR